MQAKIYKLPSKAYPRYNDSLRNGISIYKQLNVILKDVGFDIENGSFNLPEIEDPQIIVACEKEQTQTIDEVDIKPRNPNEVQELENKYYSDLETLLDENKVDNKSPKIVVLELKQNTSTIGLDFDKWKHNVIIVTDEGHLKQPTGDDVRQTKKENLRTEICLMLKRIAFRNMLPLIEVLRSLSAMATVNSLCDVIDKSVTKDMHNVLKTNNFFQGWMKEINNIMKQNESVGGILPRTERSFEKYLLKDSQYGIPIGFRKGGQSKAKLEEETGEVEEGLVSAPIYDNSLLQMPHDRDIETSTTHSAMKGLENNQHTADYCQDDIVEYCENDEVMYQLLCKLAEHVGNNVEQEIVWEYGMLPEGFKSLINIPIEEGSIREEVTEKLFKFLISTVDAILDGDDPVEEMVLVELRNNTGVILRGIHGIIAQIKLIAAIDYHIKLIKVDGDRAIDHQLTDIKYMFKRSTVPDFEIPNFGEFKQRNKTVAEKLQESVKEVGSCGYYFDTFHIFVEEIRTQKEGETINSKIKKILQTFNISDFILCSITKPVENDHFMTNRHVTQFGAIGGIPEVGQEKPNSNDDTNANLNKTSPPVVLSKPAILVTNGEMIYMTTKPEADLPQEWPNEDVMKAPIVVKCCVLNSEFVIDNWLDPKVYSLKKGCRGTCLIISNKTFTGPIEANENGVPKVVLDTRHGTERDVQGLNDLFTQLYFHVVTHEDLTAEKLNEVLLQESLNKTSDEECFICIICSHGNNKGIYGTDGEIVQVDDITACFDGQNCTALVDKPKIFFIQACRGDVSDNPDHVANVNKRGSTNNAKADVSDALPTAPSNETPLLMPDTSIPTKADTLIACATHPGYVSLRNIVYGSWFLQAVIHVFQKYAWNESLSSMLIYVNELVARGRTPAADGGRHIRQAAVFQNSFRRKFYFFPGIVQANGGSL